ncbi:hypothetical protein GOV10_00230 [Candidatus Woesearchaeota archaeon]|nr:hypothetical protein [Candidatus Woesearchaeota archaeon]
MSFYDEKKLKGGERWIILNELDQKLPKKCEVLSCEVRKSKAGKEMPVLLLQNTENEEKLTVCAWERDCAACISEWGTTPTEWGFVGFTKNREETRFVLAPAGEKVTEEPISMKKADK